MFANKLIQILSRDELSHCLERTIPHDEYFTRRDLLYRVIEETTAKVTPHLAALDEKLGRVGPNTPAASFLSLIYENFGQTIVTLFIRLYVAFCSLNRINRFVQDSVNYLSFGHSYL